MFPIIRDFSRSYFFSSVGNADDLTKDFFKSTFKYSWHCERGNVTVGGEKK